MSSFRGARGRLSDGAYVIASITKGERSILAVRMSQSVFEMWVVQDGHIQHTVEAYSPEEVGERLREWAPWLDGKSPPRDSLN